MKDISSGTKWRNSSTPHNFLLLQLVFGLRCRDRSCHSHSLNSYEYILCGWCPLNYFCTISHESKYLEIKGMRCITKSVNHGYEKYFLKVYRSLIRHFQKSLESLPIPALPCFASPPFHNFSLYNDRIRKSAVKCYSMMKVME